MTSAAVSRDGTRVAYVAGRIQWNITEVSTSDARTRALNSSADISQFPAWMPGGTRYLFAMFRGGRWSIQDASLTDGISRRLMDAEAPVAFVRLAPDGSQMTFSMEGPDGYQLMLANLSGRMAPLDPGAPGQTSDATWSPDGRYVMYARTVPPDRVEVVRIRPGSTSAPDVLATWSSADTARRIPIDWSPDGTHVLTRSGQGRFFITTADLKTERPLPSARLCPTATGFSRDGRAVLGVCRNNGLAGAPWQLWSVDVATGSERLVGDVELPSAASALSGFSMHPDGARLATSVGILAYDIWMLEGFEQE